MRPALARMIDEYVSHYLCDYADEMRSVLPIKMLQIMKLQVGLMHQGGGLQSMVRTFRAQVTLGEAM